MTKVINIHHGEPYDVYCGRAGKGKDGYFGNPFSDGTREENIERFRNYFYERVDTDPEFKQNVLELHKQVLGCFCKPKACHCDIYVEYLENLES